MFRIYSFVLGLVCLFPFCLSAQEIHLGESDNGKTVTVMLDDVIVIALAGNPTTGFSWEIDTMDPHLIKAIDRRYTSVNPRKLCGVGGIFTFRFQPISGGSSLLGLKYLRPWEKLPPAMTFSVTIVTK